MNEEKQEYWNDGIMGKEKALIMEQWNIGIMRKGKIE